MSKFIKLWNRLSYTGLSNTSSYLSNRKIILCNQLGILVVINTLLYDILLIAFHIHSLILLHTLCIGAYLMVLWLNNKGHYTQAKYQLLFTSCLEVFVGSLLLKMQSGIFLYYFPLVCAALILFNYRELNKAIAVLLVCLLSLLVLYLPIELNVWEVSVSESQQSILFAFALISSLLLTVLCVYHLIKANYSVENELRSTVSAEEDLNKILIAREEELSTHLAHLSKLTYEIDSEKAKLSAIVENANHFIWSVDKQYKITYYNTRYKKLFYYRFGVEIHTGDTFIELLPQPLASQWKVFYDRALAGEKFSVELPGQNFYKEVFFNPILDKDKRIVGVTTFMQNIDDRKKAEIELIAAKEMAEQATKIKSDFLSNMSHEIRTPMNAVIGLTNLLLEQNPRPDQLELLQVLRFSSENLLSLINDILDLQKMEAGKLALEEVIFSPEEVINNTVYAFKFKAVQKGIELSYHIDQHLPGQFIGDSVRLTQVLNNLLSNAVKFTDVGSVHLDVSLKEEDPDRCVINFEITDTGIGISREKLNKIFQAFEQAEADTTRKYGGTGLGLAISKKLIEMQHGRIQVESTEGKGSAFSFSLPFKKGPVAGISPGTNTATVAADLSHMRLLLVEDNEVNVMVAQKFLQKWKIQADVAENGKQALEKVQQQVYDLILMDLQMPVMNGLEAARAIRELCGSNKNVPMIALTADVSAEVKEKVKESGMNYYLAKPFHAKELFQAITMYATPAAGKPLEADRQAMGMDNTVKEINYRQIHRLAEGDKLFMQELLDACMSNMAELQNSYTLSMENKNLDSLRESMHKFKSVLHLLNLAALQELLEKSKEALQSDTGNSEDVLLLIRQTEAECVWVQTELSRYKHTHTYTNNSASVN